VMSIADDLIIKYFTLLTNLTLKEIAEIEKQLKGGMNPRDAKVQLAKEIVKKYHSESASKKAEEHFVNTFSKKEIPQDIPELKIKALDILSVLVEADLCKSKGQARRDVDGGGVRINDKKVDSYDTKVSSGDVIQKGKRYFVKIK